MTTNIIYAASEYLTKSDSWECIVYFSSQDLNFNDFLPGNATVQALREFRFRSLRLVVGKDLGWGNKNPVRNAKWDFDLQTESICSHTGTTHLAWSLALPGNSCYLYYILQSPWWLHCCSSGRKMGVVQIKQASSAAPSTVDSFLSLLLSHMIPKRSCVFLTVYSSTNLSVYYNACLIYLWCQLYWLSY